MNNKVRLIIKMIDYGGPSSGADVPALYHHKTVVVECEPLAEMLRNNWSPTNYIHTDVVGAEAVKDGGQE